MFCMQVLQEQIPAVIGEIALERFAGLPDLVVIFGQPGLEFLDLAAERPAILLLLGRKIRGNAAGIPFAMRLQHPRYGTLQLPAFMR